MYTNGSKSCAFFDCFKLVLNTHPSKTKYILKQTNMKSSPQSLLQLQQILLIEKGKAMPLWSIFVQRFLLQLHASPALCRAFCCSSVKRKRNAAPRVSTGLCTKMLHTSFAFPLSQSCKSRRSYQQDKFTKAAFSFGENF